MEKSIVNNFRLSRITERFVKEREKKWELYSKVEKAVGVRTLCRMSFRKLCRVYKSKHEMSSRESMGSAQEYRQSQMNSFPGI